MSTFEGEQRQIREQVFLKLSKAGWITSARDLTTAAVPDEVNLAIKFTQKGRQKLSLLHALVSEAGYGSDFDGGQIEFLWQVCVMCVAQSGPPTEGDQEPPPRG
jgi:hypothetical protein